jgi:hypothetical protein
MRELRAAAFEREQGRCFVTGRPLDPERFELHHRMPGGMGGRGGRDVLSNLIALRPEVHNLGGGSSDTVHGSPTWSRPRGWLLSSSDVRSPASRPLLHWHLGWVFLTEDGQIVPVT